MSVSGSVYLDSSAIVKLVLREAESTALRRFLADHPSRVSCALARTEVVRAVRHAGDSAVRNARAVLNRMEIIDVDDALLDDAATLDPPTLRSLDAIHLSAARLLGSSLTSLVTYDVRMAAAAHASGVPTIAPTEQQDAPR